MTRNAITTKSVTAISLTAAHLSLGAVVTFLVLLASLPIIEPEFDPSWRFMSEYALGNYGWVMMIGFFSLALSCAALFAAIRSQISTKGGKIGLGFLLVVAAALVAAGIFPQDPVTAKPDELTTHGNLHGLAAMVGIPGFAVAAVLISLSLVRNQAWFSARRSLLWMANLYWIALVAMFVYLGVALPQAGGFGPGVYVGWFNRLVVLAQCAWLMTVAWHATQLSKQTA